jgi:predicted dinucleotide-binding enzyme
VYLIARQRKRPEAASPGDQKDAAAPAQAGPPGLSEPTRRARFGTNETKRFLRGGDHIMSNVSIIGSGNMAGTIGTLALEGGNTVEIVGRDAAKAAALAASLGDGATAGTWGAVPAGDIVILAVLFDSAVPVVREFGEALAGKVVVDITNPFNATVSGLAVPDGTSIAQMVSEATPAGTHVVKAFNTLFRAVLAAGGPLDVFMAGDDAQAKASVSAFIESLGLRPMDSGDLSMAHWLEGAGLLSVGLARNGVGSLDFSLGVNLG